jgi:hypothetical protein
LNSMPGIQDRIQDRIQDGDALIRNSMKAKKATKNEEALHAPPIHEEEISCLSDKRHFSFPEGQCLIQVLRIPR